MFELNKNIEKWHNELRAFQSMNESDVNELISHLKDNIKELNKKGLSEEESYWIAKHRLGDTQTLSMEFSKVNQALIWRKRILWLLLGYFIFALIPNLVQLFTLPLYFLDLKWIFLRTPVLAPDFPTPIPIFLFILFLIGGMFYIISEQKIILNKHQDHFFNISPKSKMGHSLVLSLLGLHWITYLGIFFLKFTLSNNSPKLLCRISASGAIFSFLWNFFLFISLVIFMILIFKRKKEKIIA